MTELELLEQPLWNPLSFFGLDYSWLQINLVTILNTWFVIGVITLFLLLGRFFLNRTGIISYLIIAGIKAFMNLIRQTMDSFVYGHFALVFSIFIFILFCNCIAIIPWTTEPTTDLNTALALGLISFFYKEIHAVRVHGIHYFKEFLEPFFVMLPINLIGHFSKIISISFRLFGNIFGGSIIMELYKTFISQSWILQLLGIFSGLNIIILLFFGIFEGLIQAFVFAMLTLTYLTLAIQEEPAGEN